MSYEIRDINLAPSGEHKIDWVRKNCPLLRSLEEDFSKEQPFAGVRIALSIHLEAKTAYLCKVLAAGGAEMFITGSNPLSTQDDVAAALVKVTTKILSMSIFSFITLFIILSTSTAVLPLPAAAATNMFAPFSFIACCCSSVHFTLAILLTI